MSEERRSRHAGYGPVLWTLAGGTLGLAVSLTRDLVGAPAMYWSPGMAALGGVAGVVAQRVASGQALEHRVWTRIVPAGVALPAVLWLGVLGCVRTQHMAPAVVSGALGVGLTLGVVRTVLWSRLAAAARERTPAADAVLENLYSTLLAPTALRSRAAWVRGVRAWRAGDIETSLGWLDAVHDPKIAPTAQATVALIALLHHHEELRSSALARVYATSDTSAHAEADGVRLLGVLRRDGADAATELGARLYAPRCSALLVGVWAAARMQAGDHEAARALLTPAFQRALREQQLDEVVDEVASVLRLV